jgi:RNA-directed DNA polymerase
VRTVPTTRGNRTSTMATRTTTIRTIATECVQSGDLNAEFTVEEIFQAYYDCRKHKRNTVNAIEFEQNLERNLMDLYYELKQETYTPGKSIVFVVTKPKPREVWAANFRDRVVHHVMYNRLAPVFHKTFDYYSFACIPEKGTLAAVKEVEKLAKSATESWSKPAYYLKCDISNFFVSLNKQVLDNIISRKIPESRTLRLTRKILWANPVDNCYVKSPLSTMKLVPEYKSLFNATINHGLPIGNLSSQFFANIYLNELDRFCRSVLKCKRYARYVDDVIIFGNTGTELFEKFTQLNTWATENLFIQFNPKKTIIQPISRGINFVGYIIKPYRKILRKAITNRAIYKASNEFLLLETPDVRQIANSYFGMMRNGNCYNIRKTFAKVLTALGYHVNPGLTKITI